MSNEEQITKHNKQKKPNNISEQAEKSSLI